jgi:ABC-type dipeptide/oligopeptide/nickel transport system permease component
LQDSDSAKVPGAFILGVLIELAIGVTTGIIVAVKRGVVEGFANIFVLVGLALPQFWSGIILLFLASLTVRAWLGCDLGRFVGAASGSRIAPTRCGR